MKVALAQMDIAFREPDINYQKAVSMIADAARQGADTVVLPELWNTGFFPKDELDQSADSDGERTRQVISQAARQHQINVVAGSVLTKREGKHYNTAYVFDRSGQEVARYDKIHLFSYMGEHNYFSSGDSLCTFELDGVTCGLIICYDLRFVELIRSLCLKGIDVLFVPAAWPDKRRQHWVTLNRARAIENQIYVANVNCSGLIDGNLFAGYSSLIDPWGEYVVQAAAEEGLLIGEIDLAMVQQIRDTINVYRDRRPDLYELD